MRIDIVTCLPELVTPLLEHSIIGRARERGLIEINVINLRDFTEDKHKTTDDLPYGGGGGMVMKIEPIHRCLNFLTQNSDPQIGETSETVNASTQQLDQTQAKSNQEQEKSPGVRVAITDPRGKRFTQEIARDWATDRHLILLCGHYEGVDDRVRQHLVTDEISIGDFILTGGELPALVITDALTRLQVGTLGDADAPDKDSFSENLLEYPHYTRPKEYNGWVVPQVLLNGNHLEIEKWRRWHQLKATQSRRPDLFGQITLSKQDIKLLSSEEPTAPPDPREAKRKLKEQMREASKERDAQPPSNGDVASN